MLRPRSGTSRSSDQPAVFNTCLTSEYPLECRPEDSIASTTSPLSTRSTPRILSRSTTPVAAPAMSYSPGSSSPGCSAVSPPSSAQPASAHASAMPLTISAIRSGTYPPAGDVVGHEQRFRPAHHQVVDHHAHQVEADGVVHVHRLGDGDLGADAVGRGGQHRMVELGEPAGIEESGEAADAAHHLGAPGLRDPGLHQLDGPVPGLDVDPRSRIRALFVRSRGSTPLQRLTAWSRRRRRRRRR